MPHFAVQTRIELIRAHIALADLGRGQDAACAKSMSYSSCGPASGILAGEAGRFGPGLPSVRGSTVPGASALTAAELRLLPLISTHLSFPEIAAEQFLSPHTIKTQAMLDLPEARGFLPQPGGQRARELGLLEG